MFNSRTTALLFVALLVCGTFAHTSNNSPRRYRKGVSTTSSTTLRGVRHHAVLPSPKILVRKSRGASSSGKKSVCAPVSSSPKKQCAPVSSSPKKQCAAASSKYTVTVAGTKTLFNDTWETIGYCSRTWQQVKEVQTTIDVISVETACADTITNQKVNWQVLTNHKANQKVVRHVRTHINVLRPKKVQYETLVTRHVQYQTVTNQNVCVQTYAQQSGCVGELVGKKVNQRVVHSEKACARTLVAQRIPIKKVKKVNELVSQTLFTTSACLGIRNGVSIHNKHSSSNHCAPVKSSHCAPVKSVCAPVKSVSHC